MPLAGKIQLSANARQTSAVDLVDAAASHKIEALLDLVNGTGAGMADRVWSDTRTLAASASEDLDLVGAALLDGFGAATTFPKVTGLIVRAAAGNTNNVVVGAGTNPWVGLLNAAGTLTLRPGAVLAVFAGALDASGYATVPATGDILKVANSAGSTSVSYDVLILGKSA